MIDLNDYFYFVHVVDKRGFSPAARALDMPKSRLSRHVSQLEQRLGAQLIQRTSRQFKVTETGRVFYQHARALIGAADPVALAEQAVRKGLTVRQVEELARRVATPRHRQRGDGKPPKDADTRQLEGDLSAAIGMGVSIYHAGDGGGEIRIRYRSLDDLDRLCQSLAG